MNDFLEKEDFINNAFSFWRNNYYSAEYWVIVRRTVYLYNLKYSKELIVASLLFELWQDNKKIVKKNFSQDIVDLIMINYPDSEIGDRFLRDQSLFRKICSKGKEPMILQTAVLLFQSFFYQSIESREDRKYFLGKIKVFNNLSLELTRSEQVWQDLNLKYEQLKSF